MWNAPWDLLLFSSINWSHPACFFHNLPGGVVYCALQSASASGYGTFCLCLPWSIRSASGTSSYGTAPSILYDLPVFLYCQWLEQRLISSFALNSDLPYVKYVIFTKVDALSFRRMPALPLYSIDRLRILCPKVRPPFWLFQIPVDLSYSCGSS